MITPTKGIAPQRALLTVGAQIASVLDQPLTVSQTWSRLRQWREDHDHRAPVPFWWFTLALDVLFSLGAVYFDGELLVLRRVDAEKTGSQ
ncbi:ABC-three component system middle component 6 [Kutzneria sp. 744]|uniref:ABC-three component system middle component 6 n=1 Tax=Kutzneria sp. (strain 744) TaxID=345341 RepID=UPI000A034DBA|nr:ABC-three component system middle component 6 [Kutzneria sp. 744]